MQVVQVVQVAQVVPAQVPLLVVQVPEKVPVQVVQQEPPVPVVCLVDQQNHRRGLMKPWLPLLGGRPSSRAGKKEEKK